MQKREGDAPSPSDSTQAPGSLDGPTKTVETSATEGPTTLEQLYVTNLTTLFEGEYCLFEALPTMAELTESQRLADTFLKHQGETETQLWRLEQLFDHHDLEPERADCPGFERLIDRATGVADGSPKAAVRDAALVAAARTIKHYEISRYGTTRSYAERIGFSNDLHLLTISLEEEQETNAIFNEIAADSINVVSLPTPGILRR